ncbi:hypothetical protein SAMN04488564_10891 [Lentzea waywayandensis]|uniref:Uncharacterized protein n=1 Tax=Lentzea waywayandensis TaxID=84724 RepID=A0A1I6F4K8_9PSEU|nr:hypothetical protein [Lentzea waywayandensis]SFR24824.1 hypothetical protein SAMN04488564_10891 [Lentzea waywayandensis]
MSTLSSIQPIYPIPRVILVAAIQGTAVSTNSVKAHQRSDTYDLFEQALLDSGSTTDLRDRYVDRVDGPMALLHPSDSFPKTWLLTRFAPRLRALLDERNAGERQPLRLAVAIHSGDVACDYAGWFGEEIEIANRLLAAPALKARLQQTSSPLVLVVSEQIHRSVVRHGYDGIDAGAFTPLIELRVAGLQCRGWVHVPG